VTGTSEKCPSLLDSDSPEGTDYFAIVLQSPGNSIATRQFMAESYNGKQSLISVTDHSGNFLTDRAISIEQGQRESKWRGDLVIES
jgi:hypothetical protein